MELKDIIESGLKANEAKLAAAIEKFEGQLKEKSSVDTEVKGEVRELSESYKAMAAQLKDLAQRQESGTKSESTKTAAQEFVASAAYKGLVDGSVQRARFEVKNTVTTDSTNTSPMQKPGIIPGNFAPMSIRSVLNSIGVSGNMVNAIREASWTSSAAEVAQAAAKPESAITFEQYNVPITTVAHWIKISNQLLADAPAVVSYIETRLRDGLAQRIDAQLLNGNGTAPNLSGLTDTGNFTAYTPTAGDLLVDAINRAKYALWATGNAPDTVIVNPAAWGAMERTREGAGTGLYLYGMPGVPGNMNPFGVQIVLSNHMPAANFMIGALRQSAVVYSRQGSVIDMGYVNDDFTKNLITIRAEERLGLGVERPVGILYGAFSA
jgi:HK97 family phage major capsid protein